MCVANSARSQMAEGLARTIAPKDVPIYSAGSFSSRLHPFALRVMDEIGIDISEHFSKTADTPGAKDKLVGKTDRSPKPSVLDVTMS